MLLEAEENPNNSTRQLALNNNVDHSFIVKLFKKEKDPYKVQLIHELNKDDSDRRAAPLAVLRRTNVTLR
jgi:hypothetical protein